MEENLISFPHKLKKNNFGTISINNSLYTIFIFIKQLDNSSQE